MRRLLIALAAASTLASAIAALAGDAPAAREAVGKPVQAAQALLKQKRAKEALARLREADSVKDKTPYESYVIAETRAAAQIDEGDYAGAIASLEAALATGVLSPSDSAQRLRTLTQLAYQEKAYPATVRYAERFYARGGTDRLPRVLMAQAYYEAGDFAAAARTVRVQLRADAKAGDAPTEDLLVILASSEFKSGDAAGYRDALTRLVAAYPKPQYWIDLLTIVQRAPGFADRLRLDVDRLRLAADAFEAPAQYMEAAERALAAGLPGDARAFLDRGLRDGGLGTDPAAARARRLADLAERQAVEDAKRRPALAAEADAAAGGAAWQALGEAYASAGDAPAAIAAFEKALRKGGLRHPEDATLHLAIACLHAGEVDRAKALLSSIEGKDGTAALAGLWLILNHLDTGSPAGKDSRS